MGKIWRSTMVFLSTLAALVIIALAEEEYEDQFANRREIRSRMSDTGTPRIYEQPWRTLELEPVQQSQATTPDDLWMANSSGEPPRRRRLGRKRKRRPEHSTEEMVPIARYGYAEETRPYIDVNDRKAEEEPKRRRKKQESKTGRWDTQVEEDRPIRRRGLRRKRPSVETWPSFSEFSEFRPEESAREVNEHVTVPPVRVMANDYDKRPRLTGSVPYAQPLAESLGTNVNAAQNVDKFDVSYEHTNETEIRTQKDIRDDTFPRITEDTSISEFSSEDMNPIFAPNVNNENSINNLQKKARSKAGDHFKNIDKAQMIRDAQRAGPIDPSILKEILKKSNGSSLSEILQQNNLTLADLLHGKEEVLSVLQPDSLLTTDSTENIQISESSTEVVTDPNDEKILENAETKYTITTVSENESTTILNSDVELATEVYNTQTISEKPKVAEPTQRPNIRKFPTATRRKQRIRPMMNTTYKSQLSRDMIALNARKYFNNRRKNNQEWRELAPLLKKNITTQRTKKVEVETTTANYLTDETTIQELDNCTKTESDDETNNVSESLEDIEVITIKEKTVDAVANSDIVQRVVNVTEKPTIQSTTTPVNASNLRRQAFNNRLKKKRLKQKNLTTEPPQDDIILDLFGIPNLVSSSEFIAQTAQPPSTQTEETPKSDLDDITMDDFITTEMPRRRENRKKSTRKSSRTTTTPLPVNFSVSTEETAKMEIEEIFNDTQTSMKLARILKERNMTLSELVEHRERGSSHVHLADIFHNASKEPNPPEPFLSKSLIEPISKETYPLRALLDANNHDTTARPPNDPVTLQPEVNIPIVMNFGSNVNENAENMGIMSLFHNITRNDTHQLTKPSLNKDSQGTLYETSITVVNTTDGRNENNTIRESRVLHVMNDNQEDIVGWNEIFSLMRKNYENLTEDISKAPTNGLIPAEKIKKASLEEDLDGDGVIVLEDLQHLKDFDSNIASASNENLDFNTYQRAEGFTTKAPSLLDKLPSQTRSVTVATASIAGLAMVLFLLTYVGYRWQQQRTMTRKKSFHKERVPSPVFENRKGNKNNSSSRSISPMLTSNIYTLNTLDSRNGKESPDYMWDSLRKPFQ